MHILCGERNTGMDTDTSPAMVTGENGDAAGAGGPVGPAALPYCASCGHWAGMIGGQDTWRHFRGNPATGYAQGPYDAGHDVELAWCVPPAGSVSPAQHEQLLAALDDAIAYREHAAASGYATAYRMLRRQLSGTVRRLD
jgi:hypothetical protein